MQIVKAETTFFNAYGLTKNCSSNIKLTRQWVYNVPNVQNMFG